MLRRALLLGACAISAAGCASLGFPSGTTQTETRLQRAEQSQSRLEMRLDEMTRNLLQLRERLALQEETQKELVREVSEVRRAQAERPPEPPLTVVKVEPLSEPLPPPRPPPVAAPALDVPKADKPAPLEKPAKIEKTFAPAQTRSTAAGRDREAADLYRRAFSGFREGRFGQAILDFEDFLRRHPDHEYADNAQYWIGESYYSQGEYEQAIVEFSRVLDRYPDESRCPDALLKLGLCYDKLGDADKARVFWTRLDNKYPDTEAGHQARKYLQDLARR